MGIFAGINDNNIVEEIISIPNEFDEIGEQFINETLQLPGKWRHSSSNGNPVAGSIAFIGCEYLPDVDKFMPLKPEQYPSFIFDTDNWKWVAPIPAPKDADWLVGFTEPPVPFHVETDDEGIPTLVIPPVIPSDKNVYDWHEQTGQWLKTTRYEPSEVPSFNIDNINFDDINLDDVKAKQKELAPASFVENEAGFMVPPVAYPTDGKNYHWDESTISWIESGILSQLEQSTE